MIPIYPSIYRLFIYLSIYVSILVSISLTCCLWGQLSPLALVIVRNQEGCCSCLFAFNSPHLCIKMHKSLFQVYNFFIAGKLFNKLYHQRLRNDVQLNNYIYVSLNANKLFTVGKMVDASPMTTRQDKICAGAMLHVSCL